MGRASLLIALALAAAAAGCDRSPADSPADAGVDGLDGGSGRDGDGEPDAGGDGGGDASTDASSGDGAVDGCDLSGAPVLDVVLVDFWIVEQPERRAALVESLPARFGRATTCLVGLRIVEEVDLEVPTHDTTGVLAEYPHVDERDAERLWYMENQDVDSILSDIASGIAEQGVVVPDGAVVVALSEPQFEAGAYYIDQDAYGLEPLVIIESHTLGGWALGEGYTTRSNGPVYLAEEVIHELGHFMGLRHACQSCGDLGEYEAMMACCDGCPYADDVMSYCRDRVGPEDEQTNVFLDCTLAWLETGFVPAFTSAQPITYQPEACEG